jgi:hypothetical protein
MATPGPGRVWRQLSGDYDLRTVKLMRPIVSAYMKLVSRGRIHSFAEEWKAAREGL